MKKVLLLMVSVICIVSSFIAGFYYCKKQVVSGNNRVVNSDIDRIAIVNLDEGINKDDEKVLYSTQLLKFAADYNYVGLNEAKVGIEKGTYAAYIVIPADFSKCLESINNIPQKVKVEYVLNQNLTDKNRLEAEERLNTFKELLNSNTAYLYLSSVLSEFHDVQDSATIIMEHDEEDLNNIENINPDEIFTMIDFSEMEQVNDDIEDIDLAGYIDKNSTEVDGITSVIDNGIAEGEKKYSEIEKQYSTVTQEIDKVKNTVSSYNPLADDNGNMVYEDGLKNLKVAIDEYNANINLEGTKGSEEVEEMIAQVAGESICSILSDAQKNADEQLEIIQKENAAIVEESVTEFDVKNKEYYTNVSKFIKQKMDEHINNSKTIITDVEKKNDEKLDKLAKSNQDSYSKDEVRIYMEELINLNKEAMVNIRQELINSELYKGYTEQEVPTLHMDSILLPEVKALYTEEESSQEEAEENEENIIFVDVDKDIDTDAKIEKEIENQENEIAELIGGVKSNFVLSKESISNIIDNEIIGKIETENQNEITNYNQATSDLVNSIDTYDGKITKFNPYDYISKDEIGKHTTALSKNIMALGNAMSAKNAEYLEFVNQVYQTANKNIDTLQEDMENANEISKKNLNQVIAELKTDKKSISQEDNNILGSFSEKLPYSRLGSLEYTEMYKFMINPIETTKYEEGQSKETDKDEVQLNYKWIIVVCITIALLFVTVSLIIRILNAKKELERIENE